MPDLTATRTIVRAAAGSHPGLRRENNEDRYHSDVDRGIFMVIDGVGGHAAGERAADIALTTIRARLERETGAVSERVREAIALANNAILQAGQADGALTGMACVLTVAVVRNGRATIGHVGDSRLYKLRPGSIQKLTRDHSPVGDREDRGELSEHEAMRHPRRNEIYRDVGSEPHRPDDADFVDLLETDVEPDCALLICSDGLSDLVPAARIAEIGVTGADDPSRVVNELLKAAIDAGGKDNVTVVFAEAEQFAPASRAWLVSSHRRGARPPLLATASDTVRRALRSRVVALAVGCVLGIALIVAALSWTERAPLALRAFLPAGTWPRIWVVNADGSGDAVSIREALDRARAGDTVRVEPGEYAERIVLTGSVTLISSLPRGATIAPSPDGQDHPAVEIQAGGARISGFRIAGDDRRPLAVGLRLRRAEAEADNIEITGTRVAAIDIVGQSAPVVRSSSAHDNAGFGIRVGEGASPRLLNNVIADNGRRAVPPVPAVEVLGGAHPLLSGNIVINNGIDTVRGLPPAQLADLARDNVIGRPAAPVAPIPTKKAK